MLNDSQADAIRVKVGFPLSPDTRNPRSIAAYYNRVTVHETTFFENMLSARYVEGSVLCQRDAEAYVAV